MIRLRINNTLTTKSSAKTSELAEVSSQICTDRLLAMSQELASTTQNLVKQKIPSVCRKQVLDHTHLCNGSVLEAMKPTHQKVLTSIMQSHHVSV